MHVDIYSKWYTVVLVYGIKATILGLLHNCCECRLFNSLCNNVFLLNTEFALKCCPVERDEIFWVLYITV